jgi:hypothetical protein
MDGIYEVEQHHPDLLELKSLLTNLIHTLNSGANNVLGVISGRRQPDKFWRCALWLIREAVGLQNTLTVELTRLVFECPQPLSQQNRDGVDQFA